MGSPQTALVFEESYELGEAFVSRKGRKACIWKATSRTPSSPGEDVVVKLLPEASEVSREASLLLAVQGHPNLMQLHGVFQAPRNIVDEDEDRQVIVTEYCAGGSLCYDLAVGGAYSWQDAACLSNSLLQVLAHVHSLGIVHRDVQPANLMLRGDGEVVLGGFSVAISVTEGEELQKRCGAPGFAAPEVIAGHGCSALSDVFSAGCTIFCALSGTGSPFAGADPAKTILNTLMKKVKFVGSREVESLSAQGKAFVNMLLEKEPTKRHTAAQALLDPWLQKALLLG